MDKSGSSKPLIGSGWLRVLLYIIALFLLVIIFLSFFILGLYNGKFDATTLQSIFKKENLWILTLILFVLTVVTTFVFRRWVDRKSFISIGLDINGHVRKPLRVECWLYSSFVAAASC